MGDPIDSDVLIVGAGPCGLVIANLLGIYGIRTVVVDRETSVLDFPRAVGIDDESLRTCQTIGLVDDVLADTIQNTPIRYYTSWRRCFAHVKPSAQPFGWPRRNLFLQPMFESTLRRGASRFGCVETRYGHELDGFDQDGAGVTATLTDDRGTPSRVRAQFLVGADGGRSTIRRILGVEMTGETAPVKWLVVDVSDDQLDAPYSAVYCDPDQPVLMVPLPYRHRRWEFKLQPDDDEAEQTSADRVLSLLAPRYAGTPLPTIVHSRVYMHHSRTAVRFGFGRVFLAGDAAHMQPPFFGQGMNSGLRDATNLAWKLAATISGRADRSLLDTYDAERRPHAAQMVEFATRIGRMYSPRNLASERLRDLVFRALQILPGGKEYILQMKYKPMPHYTDGFVVHQPGRGGGATGRMFMQPDVETFERHRCKLDDAIGPWFAVVGIHFDARDSLSTEMREWWLALGATFVRVVAPRSGNRPPTAGLRAADPDTGAGAGPSQAAGGATGDAGVLEDVDGGFRDWLLARPGDEIIVLRPDRYVAAVADRAGFDDTSRALRRRLGETRSAALG